MKRLLLVLGLVLAGAALYSQPVNFSGTWHLNTEKSQLNAEFSLAPVRIILSHEGNNLTAEKHSNFQGQEFTSVDKLTLDGKECTNPGFMEAQKKSTAVWSGDRAFLTVISKMNVGDAGDVEIKEIYRIRDGSLVIESTASSSYGDLQEVMVYNKK